MKLPKHKNITKAPSLNPDPLTCWSGTKNIAWVRIDDKSTWALLDNDSSINALTPEFNKAHSLDVGPLIDLVDGRIGINGFGRLCSEPWGYIIIRVQAEEVWVYDEDQVALVVPDSTTLGSQVLVNLGMLTTNQLINMIKEKK